MDKPSFQKFAFYAVLGLGLFVAGRCTGPSNAELRRRAAELDSATADWRSAIDSLTSVDSLTAVVEAAKPDTVKIRVLRTRTDTLIVALSDSVARDSLSVALQAERAERDSTVAALQRVNVVLLEALYQRDSLLFHADSLLTASAATLQAALRSRGKPFNCVGGVSALYNGGARVGLGVTCGFAIF